MPGIANDARSFTYICTDVCHAYLAALSLQPSDEVLKSIMHSVTAALRCERKGFTMLYAGIKARSGCFGLLWLMSLVTLSPACT